MPNYQAGEPLTKLSAAGLNRSEMAGDWFVRNKALAESLAYAALTRETDIIKVKNFLGAEIEKGDVVEVHQSNTVLDETTNRHLWFAGEGVLETRGFGIAREPIAVDEPFNVGEIQVSGVCKAKVVVGSGDHKWARPKEGEVALESGFYGPCFILHYGSEGEDFNEATVVIAQPHMVWAAKMTLLENMCPNQNAVLDPETWTPYKQGPFFLDPVVIPEEAVNAFGIPAKSGDQVLVVYDGEDDEWEIWQATPHEFEIGGRVELDLDLMQLKQSVLLSSVWTCNVVEPITIADLTDCPPEGS